MRGVCGSHTPRRPLRWAVTGAGAVVAAVLTVLALTGTLPFAAAPDAGERKPKAAADPYAPAKALRPAIVGRRQWGADPRLLDQKPRYADSVHAVVIHHTGHFNDYDCAESPGFVRDMYEAHAVGKGWGDLGYNFLVDRCGTVYEGRLGGAGRAVVGAHTLGLNRGTTGIAVIGTYPEGVPVPKPLQKSLAVLIAWKLGLTGIAPTARTRVVSTNRNTRFAEEGSVSVPAVLGHIDAYETSCPGESLVQLLPALRKSAAQVQSKAKVLVKKDGGRTGSKKAKGQARRAPGGHARLGGAGGGA
ncbi:peptidoglycan recognition protein [Streptomyces sp. NPDC004134]|uniref:peptidoglycan recognition protein family protein n=1 Tax=Streptomyces sp. NPDC004134 TaxID=3364691 RepID=UPI0036BE79AC